MTFCFNRFITAMVTPFDETGEVNLKENGKLVKYITGISESDVIISGTTGESSSLSYHEKLDLLTSALSAKNENSNVILGSNTNNFSYSCKLSEEAEVVGADGLVLVMPYYLISTQAGLKEFLMRIAERVEIPVMLYNVPHRTGVNAEVETLLELLEVVPNIVAVKEANPDEKRYRELVSNMPMNTRLYSGNDSEIPKVMKAGGFGVVSVAGNAFPKMVKKLISLYADGKIAEGDQFFLDIKVVFESLFVEPSPIPIRAAVSENGFNIGTSRLPITPAMKSTRDRISKQMSKLAKEYKEVV